MKCVYCGGETQVVNSRLQKRVNQTWRRRQCVACKAIFSTHEAAAYDTAWRVETSSGTLQPFNRTKLLVSLYKSLGHREHALHDAEAISDTIVGKLLKTAQNGLLERQMIVETSLEVLKHFDTAAAVSYAAFHKA